MAFITYYACGVTRLLIGHYLISGVWGCSKRSVAGVSVLEQVPVAPVQALHGAIGDGDGLPGLAHPASRQRARDSGFVARMPRSLDQDLPGMPGTPQ